MTARLAPTVSPTSDGRAATGDGPGPVLQSAVSCLRDEADALDTFLAGLGEEEFGRPTPLAPFDVASIVRHLISVDWLALLAMTDAAAFTEARDRLTTAMQAPVKGEPPANQSYTRLQAYEAVSVGALSRDALIDRWRSGRQALLAAATAATEDRKVEWFSSHMRMSRLLAARQMELFCYGQDVYDSLEVHRINTDRIRPVADFGVRTRRFSFVTNGLPAPDAPFVSLLAPSGRVWTWGDPGAAERITGLAEQFCLVVTQRRHIDDTSLKVTGPGAARWMEIAQTIAGAPLPRPAPGARCWEASGRPNAPALPHPPTVSAMLRYMASRYADRPQVIETSGETSFAEIERRSRTIAAGLLARGAAKGARIGVMMPNGADWLSATFAIQRIGGVAVLLSTFAKGRELAHIIRHSDIHALLMSDCDFNHSLVERVAGALPGLETARRDAPLMLTPAPFLRAIHVWGSDVPKWAGSADALNAAGETLPAGLLDAAEAEVVAADPAVIIYTSGSSAEPKAVVHTQGNLVRQAHRMSAYMTYQPGDRLVTTMPLFWVGGFVTSALAAHYSGAALVCPATPDAGDVAGAVEQFGVTHAALWPAQLTAVLAHDTSGELLARLRPSSAQQLGLFGQASHSCTPNSLGMTETLGPFSMEYYGVPLPETHIGSFGRQVGTIERIIVDPDTGTPLAPGSVGEIALRGGHLMNGMHRRERDDVFTPDGWYRTGDLGRISEDGHLFFEGRCGDMVKSSGANISPREVELALAAVPAVQEAIVLGLPDDSVGELLVAVIVLKPGAELDEATVKARLRADLSSYKVPKRIYFMEHDALPRTPSAKVQKHALRNLLLAR